MSMSAVVTIGRHVSPQHSSTLHVTIRHANARDLDFPGQRVLEGALLDVEVPRFTKCLHFDSNLKAGILA
jgi:hypothetical protein